VLLMLLGMSLMLAPAPVEVSAMAAPAAQYTSHSLQQERGV